MPRAYSIRGKAACSIGLCGSTAYREGDFVEIVHSGHSIAMIEHICVACIERLGTIAHEPVQRSWDEKMDQLSLNYGGPTR